MRRIILMAIASSALALAAPQVASAHHGRHHHKHHARHARLRHFGTLASTTTTTPTSPVTPAGTVKSFTEGVLTITLADTSTVSGKVTEDTELGCFKPGTEGSGDDDNPGDDDHAQIADHHGDGAQGAGDDDQGDDDGPSAASTSCTTAALVPGAVVLGAELRIGPSGAVWKHIVLSA
jgi:hypothetical protein